MVEPTSPQHDPVKVALGHAIHSVLSSYSTEPVELGLDVAAIADLIERPPEEQKCDYAFPCFRFAKPLKAKPQDIAQTLAQKLKSDPSGWVVATSVANAFVNISINQAMVAEHLLKALADGSYFARKDAKRSATKVMIEFSQPNTHKEFHIGHTRNVCLGDSLVRLYRYLGYQVVAANYFGDEGTHTAKVVWYIRKHNLTPPADANKGTWLGEQYVLANKEVLSDDPTIGKKNILEVGQTLLGIESKTGPDYECWHLTRQWSLDEFDQIYADLSVKFDKLFYESDVSEESQTIVDEYLKKGVFKEDQGAIGVDLKPFKLGFCMVRKSNGASLYITKDLALARVKFDDFKIDRSVYVVGNEQNLHFKQVFKLLELMGFGQAKNCFHLSYGMVTLPEGKMSSRSGNSLTYWWLRGEVAKAIETHLAKYAAEWSKEEITQTTRDLATGAIKYGMLASDPVKDIVFELENWVSFEGNTGPYLMYSFARTRSILRKAKEQGFEPRLGDFTLLTHETEHDLLRHLYDFHDMVEAAAENYRPSTLATHLFYMCKAFNRFYTEVQVIKAESDAARGLRLALVEAFTIVLKRGLDLLGITPPERM